MDHIKEAGALCRRAEDKFKKVEATKDGVGLRNACDKAWLAVVVLIAQNLGRGSPQESAEDRDYSNLEGLKADPWKSGWNYRERITISQGGG